MWKTFDLLWEDFRKRYEFDGKFWNIYEKRKVSEMSPEWKLDWLWLDALSSSSFDFTWVFLLNLLQLFLKLSISGSRSWWNLCVKLSLAWVSREKFIFPTIFLQFSDNFCYFQLDCSMKIQKNEGNFNFFLFLNPSASPSLSIIPLKNENSNNKRTQFIPLRLFFFE